MFEKFGLGGSHVATQEFLEVLELMLDPGPMDLWPSVQVVMREF